MIYKQHYPFYVGIYCNRIDFAIEIELFWFIIELSSKADVIAKLDVTVTIKNRVGCVFVLGFSREY